MATKCRLCNRCETVALEIGVLLTEIEDVRGLLREARAERDALRREVEMLRERTAAA